MITKPEHLRFYQRALWYRFATIHLTDQSTGVSLTNEQILQPLKERALKDYGHEFHKKWSRNTKELVSVRKWTASPNGRTPACKSIAEHGLCPWETQQATKQVYDLMRTGYGQPLRYPVLTDIEDIAKRKENNHKHGYKCSCLFKEPRLFQSPIQFASVIKESKHKIISIEEDEKQPV